MVMERMSNMHDPTETTRVAPRFGLTPLGKSEWLAIAGLSLSAALLSVLVAGMVLEAWTAAFSGAGIALMAGFSGILFFRDPRRRIDDNRHSLVSPADGVVYDIEKVPAPEGCDGLFGDVQTVWRIGIFLSIFDVHMNRAPCEWRISGRHYKQGKFHDARNPLAGKENESLILCGEAHADDDRFPMAVRQVSGAVARRIVCLPEPGQKLQKGQRYGMIKFGSRTELYLPVSDCLEIVIGVRDKVRAGSTVLARWDRENSE
jgi:phosphatidylserine decarboxylase